MTVGAPEPMTDISAMPATSSTSTAMYPPWTLPTGLPHSALGAQVASLRPSAITTAVRCAGRYVEFSAVTAGTLTRKLGERGGEQSAAARRRAPWSSRWRGSRSVHGPRA